MDAFGTTNRRRFLEQMLKASALIGIAGMPSELFASDEIMKLTILHTNDTHSRIDPFPDNDPKFPGMGGVARRFEIINDVRKTEEHVLLLDSGDIFQGTPYFNMYGGELEFKLMSEMKYDAATLGNHDFDNGIEGFVKQLPHAKFPFLIANYDFSDTIMNGKTETYKVFKKGDLRIGVFGIGIELQGLVDEKLYGNTKYLSPIEKANATAIHLKNEEHCDLIICLSHLGYNYPDSDKVSDVKLAQASRNINLILGGHTHTFIDTPYKYKNAEGQETLVAQTGWAGIRLGRIDYFIGKKSKKISTKSHTVKIST